MLAGFSFVTKEGQGDELLFLTQPMVRLIFLQSHRKGQ